jgi:hypothetical protein
MTSTIETQIDRYLGTLRESLPKMSVAEREEIVREISVHIRESAEDPNSSIDAILERLGSAPSLASQYSQDQVIRKATRTVSPLMILQATVYLAKRGISGIFVFLGALLGYTLGAGLMITAILKPIFPVDAGVWVGPHIFDFGVHVPPPPYPAHEVLGWSYIPIASCVGALTLWLTTYGIRWFLKRSKQQSMTFARLRMGMPADAGSLVS